MLIKTIHVRHVQMLFKVAILVNWPVSSTLQIQVHTSGMTQHFKVKREATQSVQLPYLDII